MKKSILIISTALLSFLQINASNEKLNLNTSKSDSITTAKQIVQIYDWHVKTNHGQYSGTSDSAAHAKKMIALTSTGEVIVEKKIESFYMLASDLRLNAQRVYLWEVISTKGYGQGYSTSESQAHRMINLVASGDIITSTIIKSGLIK